MELKVSTEQLTHYSTETLAGTDKISRTISEKIMSICKYTIRWIIFLDFIFAATVIILLAILEFGVIPQHRAGFYCKDPKISFKFMGDTVSTILLIVGSFVIPLIVMWIVEYASYSASSYDTTLGYAGSRAKQIWLWYSHYTCGLIVLTFLCDFMKTMVGEPRPHFLDTCKPLEAENCTEGYVKTYTCTNTEDSNWFVLDSSRSFPSGHSALSMFTTIYIVWYLQNRLPDWTFLLKPWVQCVMCLWTITCSLTRICDNRHHWWDVLAGIVLGVVFSILTVTVSCKRFYLSRNIVEDYSAAVENPQIDFSNNRHQNPRKLLQERTIDFSESREMGNVNSPMWKE